MVLVVLIPLRLILSSPVIVFITVSERFVWIILLILNWYQNFTVLRSLGCACNLIDLAGEDWSGFSEVESFVLESLSSGDCSLLRTGKIDADQDDSILASEKEKEVGCLIEKRDILLSVVSKI